MCHNPYENQYYLRSDKRDIFIKDTMRSLALTANLTGIQLGIHQLLPGKSIIQQGAYAKEISRSEYICSIIPKYLTFELLK